MDSPINHNSKQLVQKHVNITLWNSNVINCLLFYVLPSNTCPSAEVVTYRDVYIQAVHVLIFSRCKIQVKSGKHFPKILCC